MFSILKFLVAFAMLAALNAFADGPQPTPSPSPTPKAEIIAVPGEPYTLRLDDGREARLKVASVDSPMMHTKFKIADNSCSDWTAMSCTYDFQFRRFWISLVWTKNSDQSKIGKIVERSFQGITDAFDKKLSISGPVVAGLGGDHQKLNAGLPNQSITCNDYRWLPSQTKSPPDEALITRWEVEDSAINPETKITENRATGSSYGIRLKKISDRSMSIGQPQTNAGNDFAADLLMAATMVSLSFPKDNSICQVGVASNLINEALGVYQGLEAQKKDPATLPDYIVGSDELLDDGVVNVQMKYWIFEGATFE